MADVVTVQSKNTPRRVHLLVDDRNTLCGQGPFWSDGIYSLRPWEEVPSEKRCRLCARKQQDTYREEK